jgi:uncharacterized protein
MEEIFPDKKRLFEFLGYTMPFGKYKGRHLLDLPEQYLIWLGQKGNPAGKLGEYLGLAYEIKLNGLEAMVRDIRNKANG